MLHKKRVPLEELYAAPKDHRVTGRRLRGRAGGSKFPPRSRGEDWGKGGDNEFLPRTSRSMEKKKGG